MHYHYLDMETYKRREHFKYFNSLAYPYVGLTVNVDITNFMGKIKAEKLPFFLTLCYCVSKAANGVAEFRQRILDGRIIEFERCRPSYTVALEDGTYCYCALDKDLPLKEFITYAAGEQEKAKEAHSIQEEVEESLNLLFISSLPWLSYTALVQPVPIPADSNPRITWGKYFTQEGKVLLPLSVLCHHALVDGAHIAAFYQLLSQELDNL